MKIPFVPKNEIRTAANGNTDVNLFSISRKFRMLYLGEGEGEPFSGSVLRCWQVRRSASDRPIMNHLGRLGGYQHFELMLPEFYGLLKQQPDVGSPGTLATDGSINFCYIKTAKYIKEVMRGWLPRPVCVQALKSGWYLFTCDTELHRTAWTKGDRVFSRVGLFAPGTGEPPSGIRLVNSKSSPPSESPGAFSFVIESYYDACRRN